MAFLFYCNHVVGHVVGQSGGCLLPHVGGTSGTKREPTHHSHGNGKTSKAHRDWLRSLVK